MPATKHFAPKRDVKPAPEVDFSIGFVRDGVEETHEFSARPRFSYADIVGVVKHQGGDNSAKLLPYLDRMIRRALRNDDGTPLKWRPEIEDGEFTTPDGDQAPAADIAKYTAFEAGSSRRRWVALMEDDDDVEVELEQITALFEYLTAETADRPTSRSSRSSR